MVLVTAVPIVGLLAARYRPRPARTRVAPAKRTPSGATP
jgi:hypothetical protein